MLPRNFLILIQGFSIERHRDVAWSKIVTRTSLTCKNLVLFFCWRRQKFTKVLSKTVSKEAWLKVVDWQLLKWSFNFLPPNANRCTMHINTSCVHNKYSTFNQFQHTFESISILDSLKPMLWLYKQTHFLCKCVTTMWDWLLWSMLIFNHYPRGLAGLIKSVVQDNIDSKK